MHVKPSTQSWCAPHALPAMITTVTQAVPAGAAHREVIGRHFPAMSAVEVKGLMEPGALVEIETTAVVPALAGEVQT